MTVISRLLLGLLLSGVIGFVAYKRGSLSVSGLAGAVIVGTATFGFGGLAWGLLLIMFFILSSLLSHYREREKKHIAAEKFDKGNARDLGQALANGGVGSLIAAATLLVPDPVMLAAYVGAMATVNADTWATELGVLSKKPPRLITNFKRVERGTSGGVSAIGTLATLAGALTIGLAALGLLAGIGLTGGAGLDTAGEIPAALWLIPVAGLGGLAGSLFDSLLGATVQAIYICPACKKETEKTHHICGTLTQQARGWRWLNNDLVNFISSGVGAAVAAGLWLLMT